MPAPLQILLSEHAERPFLSLPQTIKEQLRRLLESVAALAAVAPPIDPLWRSLPQVGVPVMRFEHAGVEVFYEIDTEKKTLRITSLRRAETMTLAQAWS